ncbi:hypothetical protein G3N55_12410, partial [Dissulfurirhabdus thermomarina]|nr:hypothetical protein [Dissulfurirhabdus thermomarina]
HLLKKDCVGCHGGAGAATIDGAGTPIVASAAMPSYPPDGSASSALAGGNFYWVLADGTRGHNCLAIPGMPQDPNISWTPGFGTDYDACFVCHSFANFMPAGIPNNFDAQECYACHLRISSCESCHRPAHHAPDGGPGPVGEAGGWYRFLISSYHPDPVLGVVGIEDPDWEQTVSAADHNEYNGASSPEGYPDHSLSHFCAGCHGDFHGNHNSLHGDGASPWIRHPTHIALPASGEYALYNTADGATPGPYDPMVPVARDPGVLPGMAAASAQVTPGSDQVMCLSCHRAHGSPYPDALRWDYD